MSDDVAIRVEKVSKDFLLPHERTQSIKSTFVSTLKGKKYRRTEKQHALSDISFEIKKGEFFGIVGRNGSGKSTLLKILAQIYQPTKGNVQVAGRLVPFIELGVGFNPELTGKDNVYLSASLLGFSHKEIDSMYENIVSFAELEQFMDQKLKNYSSGMQVRLAFSVAVRANADVLLIDEVLAVGDAAFQRKCFEYFKKLKRQKKTVVFVSHDMSAIREYCDRAILVDDSHLLYDGNPDKAAVRYNQLFINEEANVESETDNPDRWGTGEVVVEQVKASTTDKQVTIEQIIKANKDVESPVVGIRIRDAAGKDVTGTNTKIESISVPSLRANQTYTVTWSFPNVLSDGTYAIDPSVLSSDQQNTYDWYDDMTHFTIKKQRRLPYIVDPGFNVNVKK